jgi:hypothetical protein
VHDVEADLNGHRRQNATLWQRVLGVFSQQLIVQAIHRAAAKVSKLRMRIVMPSFSNENEFMVLDVRLEELSLETLDAPNLSSQSRTQFAKAFSFRGVRVDLYPILVQPLFERSLGMYSAEYSDQHILAVLSAAHRGTILNPMWVQGSLIYTARSVQEPQAVECTCTV